MCSVATTDAPARTLVVGLGNPILGDDGIGWRIADALERALAADPALRLAVGPLEIDRLAVGGLRLMERLVGYERVVLIDAVLDGGPPGALHCGALSEVDGRTAGHLDSAHDTTLSSALTMGSTLGAHLPRELTVVTVSAGRVNEFDEALTPAVGAAVRPAVERIVELLRRPVGVPG